MITEFKLLSLPIEVIIQILIFTGHPQYVARFKELNKSMRDGLKDNLLEEVWKFLYERDYLEKDNSKFSSSVTTFKQLYQDALQMERKREKHFTADERMLYELIRSDDLPGIKRLKINTERFYHLSKDGSSPIDIANSKKRRDILHYIYQQAKDKIFHNTNVDSHGRTIYDWAAKCGELSPFLNDLNAPNKDIKNIGKYFHTSIFYGHLDIVKALIKIIDIDDLFDCEGQYALCVAAQEEHTAIVKFLLDSSEDVDLTNPSGDTALHAVAVNGNMEIAKFLIANGAKIDCLGYNDNTPCYLAAKYGHLDLFKVLIQAGANIHLRNTNDRTLIFGAAKHGRLKIVEALIAAGVDKDFKDCLGDSPLLIALERGHFDVCITLIKAGVDVESVSSKDKSKLTPLIIATGANCYKLVQALVEAKANVNKSDVHLRTPLLVAAEICSPSIAKLLINAGAKVNVLNDGNQSPLSLAIECNCYQMVCDLIEAKADVNLKTEKGITPLYSAAKEGYLEIAKKLIGAGAKINETSLASRQTPLYIAAYNGDREMAQLLLESGAQFDLGSVLASPTGIARGNNDYQMVEFLTLWRNLKIRSSDNKSFLDQILMILETPVLVLENPPLHSLKFFNHSYKEVITLLKTLDSNDKTKIITTLNEKMNEIPKVRYDFILRYIVNPAFNDSPELHPAKRQKLI